MKDTGTVDAEPLLPDTTSDERDPEPSDPPAPPERQRSSRPSGAGADESSRSIPDEWYLRERPPHHG